MELSHSASALRMESRGTTAASRYCSISTPAAHQAAASGQHETGMRMRDQGSRGDNLLQRGEGVDGERIGLDGAAVEDGPADAEARGPHLGGEDELRHGRRHVHLVPGRDQVAHHLRSEHRATRMPEAFPEPRLGRGNERASTSSNARGETARGSE